MAGRILDQANVSKCVSNLRQISVASASYSADHGGAWPPSNVSGKTPEGDSKPANFFTTSLIPYLGRIPGTKDGDFLKSPLICPSARTDEPDGKNRYRGFYVLPYTDPDTGRNFRYGLSYAQNPYAPGNTNSPTPQVKNRLAVENASEMMLYMDFNSHYLATMAGVNNPVYREILLQRHNGRINVAFADGSVRGIQYEEIPTPEAIPARLFWSGRGKTWPD